MSYKGIQTKQTRLIQEDEIQEFQNKVSRTILDAPWYVLNSIILVQRDLNVHIAKEVIKSVTVKYNERFEVRRNKLVGKPMKSDDRKGLNLLACQYIRFAMNQ